MILICCSWAAVHESVRKTLLANFNSFLVFKNRFVWPLGSILDFLHQTGHWCLQMVVHIGHVVIVVYELQHCDSRDKEVKYVKKTVFLSA